MNTMQNLALIITLCLLSSTVYSQSSELYNLDPKQHVKGETYGEVTRFNQVYFTQEANFGSCNSKCSDYSKPQHNFRESDSYQFDQRTCTGTIHSCNNEEREDNSHVDNYKVRVPQSSKVDARYYYVFKQFAPKMFQYVYGNIDASNYRTVTFNSWVRGFVMCAICRCICDEPNDDRSVRSFSLNSLESDTLQNKVITGVQIVQQNNVFCLKIHQSCLYANGKINKNGGSWKSDNPNNNTFNLAFNKHNIHMGSSILSTADPKKTREYVVTGVKFADIEGNLALGVKFTLFEISTGKLLPEQKWVFNSFSKNLLNYHKHGHRPIEYTDNIPTAQTKLGLIQFEHSHLHDDVGQSTVPFVDLQPINSNETALSGVGLHLRGRKSSGGFIAPTLTTYA
uniref:Putative cysteine endopeptidase n=1 Tax=Culicoides nubeculosus TaxID=144565 RepID=B9URK0_CULNU|nr:putative cysteine endopeptidase [Culicoides nubeculosus]